MLLMSCRFRWAACQLDILGRLNSRPEIRKALGELPETLEDTYERILIKIPPSNRSIARKALQLTMEADFTIKEIAEAVIVDIEQGSFTTDNRLFEPTDLLEICTCLMTVGEDDKVYLAHYSVAEYLASERILDGPAATFKTSRDEAQLLLASICLVYLQNLPYDRMPTAEEFFSYDWDDQKALENQMREDYPLRLYALLDWYWYLRRREIPMGEDITELTLRLFDPRRDHFRGWQDQHTIVNCEFGEDFRLKPRPGAELSMALAYICFYDLAGVAEALLMRNLDSSILDNRLEPCFDFAEHCSSSHAEGTPLQIAAMMCNERLTKILIDHGADPNARHQGWTVLTSTLRDKHCLVMINYGPIVGHLLQAGANANPSEVCKTPLQLAVERGHRIDVVKLLLAAGADVNAVGNREAVIVDMEDHPLREQSTRQDSRSVESYYDTPLRIAEKMTNGHKPGTAEYGVEDKRLAELLRLLIQNGGISCHRSPENIVQEATCCVHPMGERESSPSSFLLPYGRR